MEARLETRPKRPRLERIGIYPIILLYYIRMRQKQGEPKPLEWGSLWPNQSSVQMQQTQKINKKNSPVNYIPLFNSICNHIIRAFDTIMLHNLRININIFAQEQQISCEPIGRQGTTFSPSFTLLEKSRMFFLTWKRALPHTRTQTASRPVGRRMQ